MSTAPRPTAAYAWLNELLRAPSLDQFRDYQERLPDCGDHTPIVAALLVLADSIRSGAV